MIAKPYGWAIRAAIRDKDIQKIDLYLAYMVRSANFHSAMVVNERGSVIAATNDGYVGKYFISFGSPYFLNVDSTVVYKLDETLLTAASPIMEGNQKIGTLIINYTPHASNDPID